MAVFAVAVCSVTASGQGAPAAGPKDAKDREPSAPAAAVAWPIGRGAEVLAVLDRRGESLCLYRYQSNPGRLELVAARSVRFDLQLEELNAAAPTPAQVRERLRKEKDGKADEPPASPTPAGAATGAGTGGGPTMTLLRVAEDQQLLCVLDPGRGSLCLYEFDAKQRRLRLAAARSLKYDFELTDLNGDGLSPEDVRRQVLKSREIRRTAQPAGE
jgi:hypothetical protein